MNIQVVCVVTLCRLANSYPRCQQLQGKAVHVKQFLYYILALINIGRPHALLLHCLRPTVSLNQLSGKPEKNKNKFTVRRNKFNRRRRPLSRFRSLRTRLNLLRLTVNLFLFVYSRNGMATTCLSHISQKSYTQCNTTAHWPRFLTRDTSLFFNK
jgi:hypothetical protein